MLVSQSSDLRPCRIQLELLVVCKLKLSGLSMTSLTLTSPRSRTRHAGQVHAPPLPPGPHRRGGSFNRRKQHVIAVATGPPRHDLCFQHRATPTRQSGIGRVRRHRIEIANHTRKDKSWMITNLHESDHKINKIFTTSAAGKRSCMKN